MVAPSSFSLFVDFAIAVFVVVAVVVAWRWRWLLAVPSYAAVSFSVCIWPMAAPRLSKYKHEATGWPTQNFDLKPKNS